MKYFTRKMIMPRDLNTKGTLFGGRLTEWIDEEAYIFCCCQTGTTDIVTKIIGEYNFQSPSVMGDIIEIGHEVVKVGTTSITVCCEVRNKNTKKVVLRNEKIVFVHVDSEGNPIPFDKTKFVNPST